MNSCIKTGANVYFPEYSVVVHGDLFKIGDCYILQYQQDSFNVSYVRADEPGFEVHCEMSLGDTPFGEGYNHESRGVAIAHKSRVTLKSALWKSVSLGPLVQAKLHQGKSENSSTALAKILKEYRLKLREFPTYEELASLVSPEGVTAWLLDGQVYLDAIDTAAEGMMMPLKDGETK